MSINPILKREMTVQSRSYGMPLMIACVNLALFVAVIAGCFGLMTRMRISAQTAYGYFLLLYAAACGISFLLLLFVTPSLTAGSISMERSMETLDLMLTTQLSPARIVIGKLTASAFTLGVLLCSSAPALLLPLLYGGVRVQEVIVLLMILALEALVLLCVGIFASSLTAHPGRATAAAYGMTAGLCAGLPVLSLLLAPFCTEGSNDSAYLLLLDPVMSVTAAVCMQTGRPWVLSELFEALSLQPDPAFLRFFVPLSLLFQLALAFILTLFAISNISPKRLVKRRRL